MKYSDIPFGIRNCRHCDMEIPDYQILCDICAKFLREQDEENMRYRRQKSLWTRYIYNKGLSTYTLPKD